MAPGGQSRIGPSARPIHRKLIIDGTHVLGDLAPSNVPGPSPDHERLIDSRKVDHCRGPYKGASLSILMRHERVLLSALPGGSGEVGTSRAGGGSCAGSRRGRCGSCSGPSSVV